MVEKRKREKIVEEEDCVVSGEGRRRVERRNRLLK